MNDSGQKHPEDRAFEIIVTGKTRTEIEQIEPPPLPEKLILDDLFLGDELFGEFGFLPCMDETAGMLPNFREIEM